RSGGGTARRWRAASHGARGDRSRGAARGRLLVQGTRARAPAGAPRRARLAALLPFLGALALGQLQLAPRDPPRLAPREGAAAARRLRHLTRARAPAAHEPFGRLLGRGRAPVPGLQAAARRALRERPPVSRVLNDLQEKAPCASCTP